MDKVCPESPYDPPGHHWMIDTSGISVCKFCLADRRFTVWATGLHDLPQRRGARLPWGKRKGESENRKNPVESLP